MAFGPKAGFILSLGDGRGTWGRTTVRGGMGGGAVEKRLDAFLGFGVPICRLLMTPPKYTGYYEEVFRLNPNGGFTNQESTWS